METIELKTMSGFRVKLFKHEVKKLAEIPFFKSATGEAGKGTEVLTAWGEVLTVDELYDDVSRKVFGE